MTPEEQGPIRDTAEAIHDDFLGRQLTLGQAACLLVRIQNLVSEAVEEAIEKDREIWDEQHVLDLKIQVAEAFEEAAMVAGSWKPNCPPGEWTIARNEIVELIRAHAKEIK